MTLQQFRQLSRSEQQDAQRSRSSAWLRDVEDRGFAAVPLRSRDDVQELIDRAFDAIVARAQAGYALHGPGVTVIAEHLFISADEQVHFYADYWPLPDWLRDDPDGLATKWAHIAESYDPRTDALCIFLTTFEERGHVVLLTSRAEQGRLNG